MLKKFASYEVVEQMILDRESGVTGVELAARHGVTPACISWWLTNYSGLNAKWFRYLMDLKRKHTAAKKKRKDLDKLLLVSADVIRRLQPKPTIRGNLSAAIRAKYGLTCTDANRVLGLARMSRSASPIPRDDAILIQMMKVYFAQNPGQGFGILFKAVLENQPYTRLQAYKVYKECGLLLRNRPKAKASVPQRIYKPMEVQGSPDRIWSMDFMVDILPSGTKYWVLNVIDDFNREAIIMKVLPRNTSKAVVEALVEAKHSDRSPNFIRTDNAPEFKSHLYNNWTNRNGISRIYIRPTKSYENAYVERFNGTFRREVLSRYEFRSIPEVQRMADDWRIRYNLSRPSFVLGGLSPVQYAHAAKIKREDTGAH